MEATLRRATSTQCSQLTVPFANSAESQLGKLLRVHEMKKKQ